MSQAPQPRLRPGAAHRRARQLLASGRRVVLGLAGPPGVGKSTFADGLVEALRADGDEVALVPMDGFHIAHAALTERGLETVKGAPGTFDVAGYVALLGRLRDSPEETVWAPRFDRGLEDAIAASNPVEPSVRLVVTEGNYLLLQQGAWSRVRPLLDECWYLHVDDAVRQSRLVSRHRHHGRSEAEARRWALGNDESNAGIVVGTRGAADAVVDLGGAAPTHAAPTDVAAGERESRCRPAGDG